MSVSDIEFLVPWSEIETHERRLPHWQQGRVAIFVTWRLADALPNERLANWRRERDLWLAQHPMPWDETTLRVYRSDFGQAVDRWLDAGYGGCRLRDPAARMDLVEVLRNFDGVRYNLHAWVLMPNHAHVLFSPSAGESASRTIGAWKGVSARRINLLGRINGAAASTPERNGSPITLWQAEYWDTLIRSCAHFAACRSYIAAYPARARLALSDYTLWLKDPAT
jgi:type I restriction enzyme R subunit